MKTFYVCPTGNDKNDGSAVAPFRSVSRALSASRENSEIIVADGWYCEYDTWEIARSNIAIHGAYGARPVISGGVGVTGWEPAGDPGRPGLMRAPLPDKISYARNFYIDGRRAERARGPVVPNVGWNIVDDPDMRFAKKIGEAEVLERGTADIYEGYATSKLQMLGWRNKRDIEFVYDVGWTHCIVPVDDITEDEGGKAFVKMRMPCFRNCLTKGGVQIGSPNYIENAYELLQTPGQWYIDRIERAIYYMPLENEDVASASCILPFAEKFINISGTLDNPVENIKISGLSFAYSSWLEPSNQGYAEIQANMLLGQDKDEYEGPKKAGSAISLSMCGNVSFEHCHFARIGSNAIDIGEGVYGSTINACRFEDISGSGIQIGGFGEKDAHPGDIRKTARGITVSNNHISGIGAEYRGSVGIIAGYVRDVNITHNEIEHCSYSGISLGWGWGIYEPHRDTNFRGAYDGARYAKYDKPAVSMRNSVTYNHIHDVMEKLFDGAGIYTLGLQNGSVICGNYIHDNAFCGTRDPVAQYIRVCLDLPSSEAYDKKGEPISFDGDKLPSRPGFPGGIYLDEASGGFYVSENLVHSVSIPFFLHDTGIKNRRVTNFIFDNSFNVYPDDEAFPADAARNAGIEPEYRGNF